MSDEEEEGTAVPTRLAVVMEFAWDAPFPFPAYVNRLIDEVTRLREETGHYKDD